MKFRIDDKLISILLDDIKQEKIIKEAFTYNDMKNAFAGGKFDARKIKSVCFIRKTKGFLFLEVGFLKEFLELIKKEKFKVQEIEDKRTKFPHQKIKHENLEKYFPFEYNEHQVKALKILLKINTGIVKAPTGSGKANIMMAFLKETKIPALIIVNRVGLCEQLFERARNSGLQKIGIWHGTKKIQGDIQFATIQSVKSLPSLDRYKILILDECHHASSKTYQDFLEKIPVPIRIGFSATPNKGDAFTFALIRKFIGPIICEVLAPELIENKVIALPKITFITVECQDTLDWQSAYEKCIINNHERNMKIVDLVERHNEQTLILIKDVKYKQGELIKNAIKENTNKIVEYVHGSSKHNRIEVINEFEQGNIDALIVTNIFNEGISIKAIKVLINASGGKSKVENLQKLGRGTRIMDGKEEVKIYDFYDKGNRFTEKHSILREKIYIKEGFTEIVYE